MVRGEVQHGHRAGEPGEPVLFVLAGCPGAGVRGLGQREVRERARVCRAGGLADALRVEGGEIAYDPAERPAVTNDVMGSDGEQVAVDAQAEQFRADERAVFEIEWRGDDTV